MESIDALFLSYYEDLDRWHNDHLPEAERVPPRAAAGTADPDSSDYTYLGRIARQSVSLDGGRYDLGRFLSWVERGDTTRWRSYDSYTATHLSGSYFRSFLARHGHDCRHVNQADRHVLGQLAEQLEPRYVLLSTTFLIETATLLEACRAVRRSFPGAKLVLGGLILVELQKTLAPAAFQRLLSAWGADAYVVSAMGEEPLLAMLSAPPGVPLDELELPSTWVRRGRTFGPASARPERALPMDENYVRWSRFAPGSVHPTVNARTARSCAFKCSFCCYPVNQGPLTLMAPETLRAELLELERLGGVRALCFADDTFNVPLRRFGELCRVLRDFDFTWYSFFRAQYADEDTAALMAESGCQAVFLGLESVDDQVLRNMDKVATRAKYERGIAALKEAGIRCHANFIVGFPGDRVEKAQAIVDFVDALEIEFFTVSPWYFSPGTPIAGRREKYGLEGAYWKWRHDTMSSEEAHDLEQSLLKAPRRSTFVSELSANGFWSELMLYAGGLSAAEVRAAVRLYNRLAGADHPAAERAADPEVRALRRILRERALPEPPPAASPRDRLEPRRAHAAGPSV